MTNKQTLIKAGDRIIVDKRMLGMDMGTFISTEGSSVGGYWGIYRSDKDGEEHIFDETVHRIIKND